MAKNLQVNLAFTADTNAAMQNLQKLRHSLTEISALPLTLGKGNINSDIQKAANSAKQLQQHLGAAMDVKTGNLNLGKLEASLKNSNTVLSTLTTNLLHAGSAGEQAFLSTYSAIAQSNMQLRQANGLAAQFMLTLKNTVKWQLSSSLIHGVISGFQNALGYAKELDTSLNNIRIVTGQSSDKMAEFAKQANTAAKALKATTTAYTDAALIYYQQGLDDKAVAERTRTTIKLANVTGESAETVSEWMTAIWNNFDDGSKSLEYYADVMTALGAATASSSKEIAAGLEKFAAVAETVGLSYENATAALATITATTRQSADVVGTALKTLFARIQDLNLGKTLEDGTELGQYSESLLKVGINVKTASGELKEMDTILAEMGNRWDTLGRAEQVALAKSVAGIRQYTQLIALMDNYDFYEANQTIAKSAEGTLQSQQEIFEESWAAATKNVKASVEDMYNSLIPKDFIIDFTNGLAKVVSGLSNVLESFGGIQTIMLLLSTVVLSKFQANIAAAFNTGISKAQNLIQSLQQIKQEGVEGLVSRIKNYGKELGKSDAQRTQERLNNRTNMQKEYSQGLNKALHMKDASGNALPLSDQFTAQIKNLQTIDKYNVQLLNLQDKITASEKEQLSLQLQQIKALGDERVALKTKTSELELQAEKLKDQSSMTLTSSGFKTVTHSKGGQTWNQKAMQTDYALTVQERVGFSLAAKESGAMNRVIGDSSQSTEYGSMSEAKAASAESLEIVKKTAMAHQEVLNLKNSEVKLNQQDLQAYIKKLDLSQDQQSYLLKHATSLEDLVGLTGDLSRGAQIYSASMQNSPQVIAEMADNGRQYANTQNQANAILGQQNTLLETLKKNIKEIATRGRSFGNGLVTTLQGFGQAAMGINMLTSAFATLSEQMKNNEVSFSAILGFITSLGMSLPMIVNSISTLTKVFNGENLILLANTIIKWENNKASKKAADTSKDEAASNKAEAKALKDLNEQELINLGLKKGGQNNNQFYQKGRRGSLSGNTKVADIQAPQGGNIPAGAGGKTPPVKGGGGGQAVKTVGQGIAKIGPYALVVAAAVAILATGITLMVKAFNKSKEEAKKAKENAAALKKEYEGVVAATNALNENIKKYEELSDKTDTLVKGTYEYKKALLESNQAAMELIKSNKILQQPGSYEIVQGKIVINEVALEQAQEEQLLQQQDALARSNRAQLSSEQANYNLEKDKALKNMDLHGYREMDEGTAWGAGAGAAVGIGGAALALGTAGAANAWNPVGWGLLIAGALTAVGAVVAGAIEGNNTDTESAVVEHLSEQWEEYPDMFKDKDALRNALGPEYEHLTEALWEEKDSLEDLIQSNAELKLQEELLTEQIATAAVDRMFGDDLDSRQKDAVTIATADIINSDELKDTETKLYKEIKGQDALVEDLYNYFNKDLGVSVELKTGDKAVISNADGTTENTTQSAIAKSVTTQMSQAAASGDTAALEKIGTILKNAKGVSAGNEEDVQEFLKELDISAEIQEAAEKVKERSTTLDTITSFSGNSNAVSHSELLDAIQVGEKKLEDTDFSFLSREELADLENNIKKFDEETQEIIEQGIATYEEKRQLANAKASANFESELYEMEERTSIITKAGLNDAEFEAFASTISNTYKVSEEQAEELAEANLRVKNGLTGLLETYKEYGKYLEKTYKGTLNYSKGIAAVQKNLQDWFGVKFEFETIEENLVDIKKALEGDIGAIDRLQNLASREMVIEFDLVSSKESEVLKLLDRFENETIEVGMNLDTSQAAKELATLYNSMIKAGLMTSEQAQKSLESLGYEVNTKNEKVGFNGNGWLEKAWNKFSGKEVEVIDLQNSYYKGDFKDQAIQDTYLPDEAESASEKKRRKKDLDDEIDRYHEIDEAIQDLERDLDSLTKAKDRAFGADKLSLIDQEIAKEKELLEASKERLNEANQYYEQDRQYLLSNYNVELDENGQISNYNKLIQQQVNKLKGMSPDDSGYEETEAYLEQMKQDFARYEETLDTVNDEQQKVIDKQHALADLALEKIEYEVQIKVDIADDDQAYLDFLMKQIEDDAFAAVEAISNLGQQAEVTKRKIAAANEGIAKIMAKVKEQGFMTDAQAESLRKYRDELIEGNTTLLEIRESVQDKLTEAYDAWNDKLDKNANKIKHLTSITESYKNIIDIVGKDTLGISDEAMAKLTDTQVNNANNTLKASKAKLDANEAFLADLQKKREQAVKDYGEDSDEVAEWDSQIEYAEEQVMSAKEDFMNSWENALSVAAEAFASHVETIVENFSEAMGGIHKNLEELQEAFDRQTEVNDRYLQQYEKTYEISKLNRSIQKSLDKTDNVGSQKELRQLQKELLAMQEDGVNVSQRDIEYMQKKYDLMVAEQALKDAQNAKSVVRLTRDSEGNFGYTYTADAEAVDDAQQTYEDKLYEMQKFGDESLQEIQEQILAVQTEFKEAMLAISTDETLSAQERQAKMEEVTKYYTERLNYWSNEGTKFMQHGQEMNAQYNTNMVTNFQDTLLGSMYPTLTSFQGYYEQSFGAMNVASADFTKALEGYQIRINTAFEEAGEDAKTFADDLAGPNGYLQKINTESDNTGTEAERLEQRMTQALSDATSSVSSFYSDYADYMEKVQQETNNTITSINDLIKKYAELSSAESDASNKKTNKSGTGTSTTTTTTVKKTTTPKTTTTDTKNTITDIKTVDGVKYYKYNGSWYSQHGFAWSNGWTQAYSEGDKATKGSWTDDLNNYKTNSSTINSISKFLNSYKGKTVELIGSGTIDVYQNATNEKTTSLDNPSSYDPDLTVLGAMARGNQIWVEVQDEPSLLKWRDLMNDGAAFYVPLSKLTRNNKAISLDTGGYTGEWGPEGRMAMLHQKEIVLNAHDTENLLTAVSMIREISSQLESNALAMQYIGSLGKVYSAIHTGGDILQQEVHITAEFPNATNHNEIEEAFRNLTNLASQYANRKN